MDDDACQCASRKGFHQHPWYPEVADGQYVHEFFVCALCNKPTELYLQRMMEEA